jgi:hypothetical protein
VSGIFRKAAFTITLLTVVLSGCGKSAYYPGYVGPCVEAKQAREKAQRAQGDEKAMLEVKAQGLEEACRNGMRDKNEQDKRNRKPAIF